jgi:hypothetical protein
MYERVRASWVHLGIFATLGALLLLPPPAWAASSRVEAAALDALRKAEGDFLSMNYASGAARLDRALRGCAPTNCSPVIQAALLRDIGTMEFRAGDRGFASKAFAEALKLQPTIELNPSYDSPDLRSVWNEAKGASAAPTAVAPVAAPPPAPAPPPPPPAPTVPPPPSFPQPTGDFTHTPAAEQRIDTPLPVYIEGGPIGVTHVVVRYKSQAEGDESEWNHTDLARVSNGWGGLIPCASVLAGTVRYYIQAYNRDMDPVGNNGDAKNPYQVPIREDLYGAAPHLPGRAALRACHVAPKRKTEPLPAPPPPPPVEQSEPASAAEGAGAECTPGTPGCPKAEKGAREADEAAEGDAARGRKSATAPRVWVGASFALDVMTVPSGDNLCLLHRSGSNAGQPLNDKFIYCTDPGNADFPTRNVTLGPALNDQLAALGQAGHSDGGTVLGTMHLAIAADLAVLDNLLVGGRAGLTLGGYPARAASNDAHASRVPNLYLEGRLTFVFGKKPFAHDGLAPLVFVGGGYGEFDADTSGIAVAPPVTNGGPNVQLPVSFWVTSGPFFGVVGGGLRYTAPGLHWVFSAAIRANISSNGAAIVPSFGPDVIAQYGF